MNLGSYKTHDSFLWTLGFPKESNFPYDKPHLSKMPMPKTPQLNP
jgi:hypothetical protein